MDSWTNLEDVISNWKMGDIPASYVSFTRGYQVFWRNNFWGKTSLVRRYMYDTFEEGTAPTVGAGDLNPKRRGTEQRDDTWWFVPVNRRRFSWGMDFQSKTAYLEDVESLEVFEQKGEIFFDQNVWVIWLIMYICSVCIYIYIYNIYTYIYFVERYVLYIL